ncbi:MAG TPA: hypothetical protein VGN51_03740 [Acidimicrobiia bacterium]
MALEIGEGVDHLDCLEGAVALPDRDLAENAGVDETLHRLVGLLVAAVDQHGCSRDSDDRCAWERDEKSLGCGVGTNAPESLVPRLAERFDAFLEDRDVVDRSSASAGEDREPLVEPLMRGL